MKLGLIIAAAALAVSASAASAQDVAGGEKVFKKCMACHAVGENAKNKVGPELNGVVGRQIASVEGFKYSPALMEHAGDTWTEEHLHAWLANPKEFAKGNKMAFAGLKKDQEITDVIAYLKTFQ